MPITVFRADNKLCKNTKKKRNGTKVFVFSPEYFLALKFEALNAQGGNNLHQCHDLEDNVNILNNCSDILENISAYWKIRILQKGMKVLYLLVREMKAATS